MRDLIVIYVTKVTKVTEHSIYIICCWIAMTLAIERGFNKFLSHTLSIRQQITRLLPFLVRTRV